MREGGSLFPLDQTGDREMVYLFIDWEVHFKKLLWDHDDTFSQSVYELVLDCG